jgi:hypothetical protein
MAKFLVVVDTAVNLLGPYKAWNFLITGAVSSFARCLRRDVSYVSHRIRVNLRQDIVCALGIIPRPVEFSSG